MKTLILFISLSLCLVGCKKDSPEAYFPKPGDTYKSVVDHWGACKDITYYAKYFNDDGDYKYADRKVSLMIISSRVDKVSKLK